MSQGSQKKQIIELYIIMFIDIISIVFSFLCANTLRHKQIGFQGQPSIYITIIESIIIICILYSFILKQNRDFIEKENTIELISILKMNIAIIFIVVFGLFIFKESTNFARLVMGYFVVINIVTMFCVHYLMKKYLRIYFLNNKNKSKVLVVTEEKYVELLLKKLIEKGKFEYDIVALVLWEEKKKNEKQIYFGVEVKALKDGLMEFVRQTALDEVFIHLPSSTQEELKDTIKNFEEMGLISHYNIGITGLDTNRKFVGEFAGYAVITYAMNFIDYQKLMIKRGIDILGGGAGLCICAILFPFIALAIKCESKGPIFFSQIRIGRNGRYFKMYKFRSMYKNAEERKQELLENNEMEGPMFKMEHDPRITKAGRFLRKTSMDELPQFYNIVKGDMSLVGTRPPTVDEYKHYSGYYKRRLSMTPGLTGLWQVSGRSKVEKFDDVVKYDLQYIDNWSLSLDIKILLKTVMVVLFRKGAK